MDQAELRAASRPAQRDMGVSMTAGDVEAFLADLSARGRAPDTLERYRRSLERVAEVLPEDGRIRRGTLAACREALLKAGCAPRSVNLYMSAANTYVAYMGRREYQLGETLHAGETPCPELTRGEYKRLLQTAKILGKERVYLLVKLFGSADLPVQELDKVTLEAVRAGQVTVGSGAGRRNIRLPGCLREELAAFAARSGIYRGPVFVNKDGAPLNRASVTTAIRDLCAEARVPVEKGSPRCLRRLYVSWRKGVEDNIALLVEQALERQMEDEQLILGWDAAV